MKIRKGCEVLSARLTELLHQATAVQRSVRLVGHNATNTEMFQDVEESFVDMASFVADTLGDVNDRLQRLDEVLKVIHDQSSKRAEPSSAF